MDGVIVPGEAVRGIPGKSYRMSLGEYAEVRNRISSFSNAKQNNSAVAVAPAVNALTGYLDQIGGIAARNSALSQQYAAEANAWSANQSAIAREFNAAEAQKNRDWQQMMSNTAHQREIDDLKAAGLNPVLSAMGGNGAAVTSGATASATVPSASKGDVDTSANASIVSLLSSLLGAQTQLRAMDVSARTQEAVAEKYTAMQRLVSEMNNATSRANAELSAATSRYGIDVGSWTSLSVAEKQAAVNKYAAELSSAASRYGAYMSWDAATSIARNQLEFQSQHPSNMYQAVSAILDGMENFGYSQLGSQLGSAAKDIGKQLSDLWNGGKSYIPGKGSGRSF